MSEMTLQITNSPNLVFVIDDQLITSEWFSKSQRILKDLKFEESLGKHSLQVALQLATRVIKADFDESFYPIT